MNTNDSSLIRFSVIDKCLNNPSKKWTLNDLAWECSKALTDFRKKTILVSKRTIELDLEKMRGKEYGYNAPIVVYQKKYYCYNKEFTIRDLKIPISKRKYEILLKNVKLLKYYQKFSDFNEIHKELKNYDVYAN